LDIHPSCTGLAHELAAVDLGARQSDLAEDGMSKRHVFSQVWRVAENVGRGIQ